MPRQVGSSPATSGAGTLRSEQPEESLGFFETHKRVFVFEPKIQEEKSYLETVLSKKVLPIYQPRTKQALQTDHSLEGLLKILKNLSKDPKQKYNIDLQTFNNLYKPTIQKLINQLDLIKNSYEANKTTNSPLPEIPFGEDSISTCVIGNRIGITLPQGLIVQIKAVSGALHRISFDNPGIVNWASNHKESPNPLFLFLDNKLAALDAALSHENPDDESIKSLYSELENLLLHQDLENYYIHDTSIRDKIFKDFIKIYKDHLSLPDVLKLDERFYPSYNALRQKLGEVNTAINNSISSFTSGKKMLSQINDLRQNYKQLVLEAINNSFKSFMTQPKEKPHPLTLIAESIKYFESENCHYEPEEKLALLSETTRDTKLIFPQFQIDETNLFSSIDNYKNAFESYIKQQTSQLEESADLETRIAYFLNHHEVNQGEANRNSTSSFSKFTNYLKSISQMLSNSEGEALTGPAAFMFQNLKSFFANSNLSETAEGSSSTSLTRLKDKIFNIIDEALTTNTTAGYLEAVKKMLSAYNNEDISLDFFHLPTFSQASETPDPTEILDEAFVDSLHSETSRLDNIQDLDQAIAKQQEKLSETLTCKAIFYLVYNTFLGAKNDKTAENLFYNTFSGTRSYFTQKERMKAFASELKKVIKESNAPSLKKATAKTFLTDIFNEIFNDKSNLFISKITTELDQHINDFRNNPHEKLSFITGHLNECVNQYQKVLEQWAETGGNKDQFLEEAISSKTFNKGLKGSYKQTQLYSHITKIAAKAITKNINVINGVAMFTERKLSKLYKAKLFKLSRDAPKTKLESMSRVAKKVIQATKDALMYIVYCFYKILIHPELYVIGLIFNQIVNKAIQFPIYKLLDLGKMTSSMQNNVYEKDPYVEVVTDLLIKMFETLDVELIKQLQEQKANHSTGEVPIKLQDDSLLSDSSREKLSIFVNGFFRLLDKNSFQTPEELKKFLENNPEDWMHKLNSSLSIDATAMPSVIDSITSSIASSMTTMLEPKEVKKKILLALETMETTITKKPEKQLSAIEFQQKMRNKELRLKTLKDKVNQSMIKVSVNELFDNFENRTQIAYGQQKLWLQSKLLRSDGLIEQFRDSYNKILDTSERDSTSSLVKKQNEMIELKIKTETFLSTLSSELAKISFDSNEKSMQKLKDKFVNIATILKNLQKSYVVKPFEAFKNLHQLHLDRDNLHYLHNNLKTLKDFFKQIAKSDQTIELENSIKDIKVLLEGMNITVNNLVESGLVESNKDNHLADLINFFQNPQWKNELPQQLSVIETAVENQKDLRSIDELLTNYLKAHKESFNEPRSFFSHFSPYQTPSGKILSDLKQKLKTFKHASFAKEIKSLIATITASQNNDQLTTAEKKLEKFKKTALKKISTKESINIFSSKTKLTEPLLKATETLIDSKESTLSELKDAFGILDELETKAKDFEEINPVKIPLGIKEFLKKQSISIATAVAQPKFDHFLKLMKDKNFARALINHSVWIPIKENL